VGGGFDSNGGVFNFDTKPTGPDDGWSIDAIECIRSGQPCRGKLTPDQQAKLDADKPDTH